MTNRFAKRLTLAGIVLTIAAAGSPALAASPVADFAKCAVAKDRAAAGELVSRLPADRTVAQIEGVRMGGASVCTMPSDASAMAVRGALVEVFYKRDFVEFGLQPKRKAFEFLRLAMPAADAPGDKFALAMCVARSNPALTDRLLATAPGSGAEDSVMQLIMPYFSACQANGAKTALIKGDLRSLIAHGAYMVSVRYWTGEMRAIGAN